MKKTFLLPLLSILLFSFSAFAQIETDRYTSSRLDNLANQLKRDTVDLAEPHIGRITKQKFESATMFSRHF